jgi:hypothetical protein
MTSLELRGAATDTGWRVTTYVPSGYTINLGQLAGTRIGSVVAQPIVSAPVAGATGIVVAADPKDAALMQEAGQCTGTKTHTDAWLLRLTFSSQTFDVPLFVDPTAIGESGFGSAKLTFCLEGFSSVKLTLSAGVFTNPLASGSFVWRALVAPWRIDNPAPNPAATFETQALVGVPASLSLKAKVQTTRRQSRLTNSVLLSGTVLENLRGVADAKISFFGNDRSAGSAKTLASGAFSGKRTLGQRTSFHATATVPTREFPCVAPLPATLAPAGCTAATRAGYRLRSNSVLVAPRAR